MFWIIQSNFFRLFTHTSHLLYWSKSFHCSRSLKRWCVLFPNIDTFIYHKMCPQKLQLLTTGQKQYVKLGLILWPYYSNQRVQNNVYIIIYINRKTLKVWRSRSIGLRIMNHYALILLLRINFALHSSHCY